MLAIRRLWLGLGLGLGGEGWNTVGSWCAGSDHLSQPVSDQWRPANTARRAVEALLGGLRGFGDFAIFFSIAVLPWLVAVGLLVLAVVALVRWRTRRSQTRPAVVDGGSE